MRKAIKIKDLGEVITGNTPPRSNPELYGRHTPFIKATDIEESSKFTYFPEEFYSEIGFQKYKKSLIRKGASCVVTIGSVGKKMTMAHCDCFINQAMNAVVPNNNYDDEYVYYLLKNNIHKLKMLNSGTASGRENISKSAFSNMEIEAILDKDKQIIIGKILSAYDKLIENNQKQIKLLEEAAQRLYKEWFVDLRFPGYEKTPIIDGVPEGWEILTLDKISCRLEAGSRPKGGIDKTRKSGIVSIGAENVLGLGKYNFNDEKFIPKDYYLKMKKGKIVDKDILIYKDGAYIGKTTLFQNGYPHKEAAVNEHVFLLHMKNEYLQYFVFFTLYQHKYFLKMQQLNKNAAQPGINLKSLLSLDILVPSYKLIEQYNFIITPIMNDIFEKAKQNIKLVEIRNKLLQKLMSGEIEV